MLVERLTWYLTDSANVLALPLAVFLARVSVLAIEPN